MHIDARTLSPLPTMHARGMCSLARRCTTLDHWCDVNQNVIHLISPPSCSIVQCWSLQAHCWYFQQCPGVTMHTMHPIAIHDKLWYTVYSDPILSEPPVALLSEGTPSSSFQPSHIQQSVATHDPLADSSSYIYGNSERTLYASSGNWD